MAGCINSKPSMFLVRRPPPPARSGVDLSARTLNLVLASPAKPRQVGWNDRLGGLRLDAERPQSPPLGFRLPGYDVVRREQIDLIAGRRQQFREKPERRLRRELGRGCNQARGTAGHAYEGPAPIDLAQSELRRLAQGHHSRTAELVSRAGLREAGNRRGDRPRDVADIDWLQASPPAAQKRQNEEVTGERAEAVEEIVLGPEHDRRTQHDGVREYFARRLLAQPLAGDIGRGGVRVRADSRN